MTCSSCEARIASALRKVDGVIEAEANLKGGTAMVAYEEDKVSVDSITGGNREDRLYRQGQEERGGNDDSLGDRRRIDRRLYDRDPGRIVQCLPKVDASIGYGMLFVIGLLTSVHCVAMCGGIALSQSLGPAAASPAPVASAQTAAERLRRLGPGLLYNGGRIISYTIVGGIVGALGSAFSFSPIVKGIISRGGRALHGSPRAEDARDHLESTIALEAFPRGDPRIDRAFRRRLSQSAAHSR